MDWLEGHLVNGMENFQKPGFGGVTETWNVIQHEVNLVCILIVLNSPGFIIPLPDC